MFELFNRPAPAPTASAAPNAAQSARPDFKIPEIPILGQLSTTDLINDVYEAILAEATTIDFYMRLIKEAPNELDMEFISEIIDEEKNHLTAFTKLYIQLTDMMPHYKVTPITFSSYKEGLLLAFKDELEATDFYKEVQVSTTDQLVQQVYYYAMVDEIEHTAMFGLMYNQK